MAYVKYLAFFEAPDIPTNEEERYSSLTKGMTKFLGQRSIDPLLQLDAVNEDYMLLYKYKKDVFIKRILENPGKYTPEEVVLMGYLPLFLVSINNSLKDLEAYLLSDEYSEFIKGVITNINTNQINSWDGLKQVIWEQLNSADLLRGYLDVIKELFTILTRAILLLKLRLLICLDNFLPETLVLPADMFGSFLGIYGEKGPSEIRHVILTIMVTQNQTLFKTNGKDMSKRLSKRIYEDSRATLGMSSVSETFNFMPMGVHLGIIMDGNRRWGSLRNLPGHFFGTQRTEELLRWVLRIRNVEELTLYCLSIDNLEKRDKDEIESLDVLLQIYLSQLITAREMLGYELEIVVIGEVERLGDKSQELISKIHEAYGAVGKPRKRLNLAIAYDAIKDSERTLGNLFLKKNNQILKVAACDNEIAGRLHDEVGDLRALRTPIDYVIRCGNVMRTSGFFPLQTLYAEWLFLPLLWPDMTYETLVMCLKELGERSRRYGK